MVEEPQKYQTAQGEFGVNCKLVCGFNPSEISQNGSVPHIALKTKNI